MGSEPVVSGSSAALVDVAVYYRACFIVKF